AAIPLRRARRIRGKRLAVHEQQFPHPDVAADVEWKRHVMIAHLAGYFRKRFQIGEEIADIAELRMRIRSIGKRRKVVRSIRRNAPGHGADKIGFGPSSDAVGTIRRDIRCIESAEWRGDRKSTAEP